MPMVQFTKAEWYPVLTIDPKGLFATIEIEMSEAELAQFHAVIKQFEEAQGALWDRIEKAKAA